MKQEWKSYTGIARRRLKGSKRSSERDREAEEGERGGNGKDSRSTGKEASILNEKYSIEIARLKE
jgi:hypothetical protein